jgi:beta-lactamase regulating signal transducer with metallopeptidase domain
MLLTNALLATALALLVAGASYISRRPALIHSLWLLVLLKLLTPPLVSLPVPWPDDWKPGLADGDVHNQPTSESLPVLPPHSSPQEKRESPLAILRREKSVPRVKRESFLSDRPRKEMEEEKSLSPLHSVPAVPEPVEAGESSTASPFPEPSEAGGPAWSEILLTLWLAGSLTWWTLAAYRIARFRRWCRRTNPAAPGVQAEAEQLARRLGLAHCPAIAFISAPVSPLLWAFASPACLLFPNGLWNRLTPDQRQTLLLHELAHLRRRDHWVRLLELLVLGLYWWHPVVWWARHELREAEEQCCDAWVVWALPTAAPAYATALVETVAFLSQARSLLPLATSGVGHVHTLKRRLTMILRGTPPRMLSGAGFLGVLALGALLLPLVPTRADEATSDESPEHPAAQKTSKNAPSETDRVSKPAAEKNPAISRPALQKNAARSAPAKEKTTGPAAGAGKQDRSEQLEKARDEVELLEAQLAGKRAEVEEAAARLKRAAGDLKRLQRLGKAASAEEVEAAESQVEIRQAQLSGKRAQLREAELRLKQAQRRLSRLEKAKAKERSDSQPEKETRGYAEKFQASLPERVKGGSDYKAALRKAREKNQPLLIVFTTQDCYWCKRLLATTLRNSAVDLVLKRYFVSVYLDAEKEAALCKKVRIESYPTLVIAAPDGKILVTQEGYIDGGEFYELLKSALELVMGSKEPLRCTQPVTDFGKVRRGIFLEHSFVLQNTSNGRIDLGQISASRGGVKAVASQAEVPAGKKTMIVVRVDTNRYEGRKAITIRVPYWGAARGQVRLLVRADVRAANDKSILLNQRGNSPIDPERLRNLEKKLDALFKDVEALRQDLRRGGTRGEQPKTRSQIKQ